MQDSELYERVLGLKRPWKVSSVDLSMEESKITVTVSHDRTARFVCPECGQEAGIYDHRRRQWRHLDTCGLVTMIEAEVPRVSCTEHGVRQVRVPWAESGIGFTGLFEALTISWLKVAPITAVADRLGISWDQTWGIMSRAVARGLERRESRSIRELGVDETSFQKRHEYVTVLVDRSDGTVIDVLNDRKKATLKGWLEDNHRYLKQLRSVSMDMWEPYIGAVREILEGAEGLICFDRFHVASHFAKAVDKVRATEHRALLQAGGSPLTRTKYDWLRSRAKGAYRDKRAFLRLTRLNLKTARAWRIKEAASTLWSYSYRRVAERNWKALLGWISRCRLEPMRRVGTMVRQYLWGIINAIMHRVTNATAESINAAIQRIKAMACGYRNRARFRTAILFHRAGLSMLPTAVGAE